MATDLKAKLVVEAQATGQQELAGMAADVKNLAGESERSAQKQTTSHRRIADGVKSISAELALVRNAYIGLQGLMGVVHSVRGLTATADAVSNLQARIKLVTGEGQLFEEMWERVAQTAQRTNSDLGATGDLFSRIAAVGKDAGLSAQQAAEQSLAITESINQAVQLSGASAEASQAAVTQLIQGLQSGCCGVTSSTR
ncbi:hypothetical protein H0I39_02045 [Ottowia beijingensis]|uniref:Tape measure protein N-terminal domain-containing protein n=1 Tax=Ottowia beijingensis TaxID=1207057 RepID=A0A853IVA2_9BURK|nr:hypothetical protein [Ottowia beijingensis]